jgi:glycosyltransferase involved in cell wall biosynthesis
MKVSIIVPVYNSQAYLEQCLDSLLAQTLADIEIVVVNDGSKDASLQIIEAYAARDSRIKYINQANGGYGKAMNAGMAAATGDYIGIVESDDWVEPDMYERLYKAAVQHKVDICRAGYYTHQNKVSTPAQPVPAELVGRVLNPQTTPALFKLDFAVWTAIYRRSFVQDIRFLETPGASYQDISFSFITWFKARAVYVLGDCLLHYRKDNEASSINSKAKVFCVLDEFRHIDNFLKDYPAASRTVQAVKNYLRVRTYFWNLRRLTPKLRRSFIIGISADIRHMLENEEIDWAGISAKNKKRCWRIAYHPRWLAFAFTSLHKCNAVLRKLTRTRGIVAN